MKKLVLFALLCAVVMGFTSCDKNKKKNADNQKVDTVLVVENLISMDREAMTLNFKSDYRWYETCIVAQDYFDSENANEVVVVGVSNIFQYLVNVTDKSADVQVVMYTHVKDSTVTEVKHDFWIGDLPMNDEQINLTYVEAYNKMMATNLPKPHSRQCVLRKELGPNECNPQYIFGNSSAQVYVDATTGEVTDKNPVYKGFESKLKKPLGEWP